MSHNYIGIIQHSKSIYDSQKNGFYVGQYKIKPSKIVTSEKDTIELSNCWVEQNWFYENDWLFDLYKVKTEGYSIYFQTNLNSKRNKLGTNYWVRADNKFSEYINSNKFYGIDNFKGWGASLNRFADSLRLYISKKESNEAWENYKQLDSLGFILLKK